jgi:DUF4097 and DUF4098 domain-containing protein YvlB
VDAGEGDIEITATNGNANVILIRATKHVTGNRPDKELKAYLPKVPVTATLKGDTLVVRSEDEGLGLQVKRYGIRYYVSYVITVPQRLALNLNTNSGDVKVDQVSGGVTVDTASGAIALQAVAGSLNLQTASGNVKMQDAPEAEDVTVSTSSGNVELENIAGRCQVHTVSGDLALDGAKIDESLKLESSSGELKCANVRAGGNQLDLKLTTASGDISYKGDASQIEAHTSSGSMEIETPPHLPLTTVSAESIAGNLNLTLPGLTSAQIDAHTISGTVNLPAGRGNQTNDNDGADRHSMTVVLGNGTTRVKLTSSSGDITLVNERQ